MVAQCATAAACQGPWHEARLAQPPSLLALFPTTPLAFRFACYRTVVSVRRCHFARCSAASCFPSLLRLRPCLPSAIPTGPAGFRCGCPRLSAPPVGPSPLRPTCSADAARPDLVLLCAACPRDASTAQAPRPLVRQRVVRSRLGLPAPASARAPRQGDACAHLPQRRRWSPASRLGARLSPTPLVSAPPRPLPSWPALSVWAAGLLRRWFGPDHCRGAITTGRTSAAILRPCLATRTGAGGPCCWEPCRRFREAAGLPGCSPTAQLRPRQIPSLPLGDWRRPAPFQRGPRLATLRPYR